ncbi:MAG: hypothetical protein MUD08_00915 [Cytophagales bacterium]|nr:hypothetical protein [Cytophagales bacterium]
MKTLKDLLQAGAITQGEFDHLKQILIDGTKASNETVEANGQAAKAVGNSDVYENPDEVIRYYSNETKNLLLYKQFDKAYPFVQKILSLRPEHREANRFLQEIKTYVRRDYLIGGAIGVVVACVLSVVFTSSQYDVNFILLCIIPVLLGVLLPQAASRLLIGRVNSRGMRYLISGAAVVVLGCVCNVALAGALVSLEGGFRSNNNPPIAFFPEPEIDTTDFSEDLGNVLDSSAIVDKSPTENVPSSTPATSVKTDTNTQRQVQPDPSSAPEKNLANKEPEPTPVPEAKEEDANTVLVQRILASYYRDLSSQKFDASKYYARRVDRFLNQRDITPQLITTQIEENFYTDFQDAVSSVVPNTLEVSPMKGGKFQADFKEVVRCYRKSAKSHQIITSRVKVVFDRNMRIIYYSAQQIKPTKFGEQPDEKTTSKMVYFQDN